MKTSFIIFVWMLISHGVQTVATAAETDPAIQFLLEYVKRSAVVFIRNGKEHTPDEAVAHMQKKYDYYKDKIHTPEEFIRYAATKSMVSGKAYQVRTGAGKIVPCSTWLKRVLQDFRSNLKSGGSKNE